MIVKALVMAKVPVPGQVKTRLAAAIGPQAAAELAANALIDTIDACTAAFGATRCHIALAGDLSAAVDAGGIALAMRGWQVDRQSGDGFGTRLAHAHQSTGGPLLQVGMDTPQLTVSDLLAAEEALAESDAVLGDAADGGWWLLGLHDAAHAACLPGIPMSTDRTGRLTRAALEGRGLRVATTRTLRDVDTAADADAVAQAAPRTRFARAWASRVAVMS